jgi:ATP-dependent Clp protease adapter protein ClpS
MRGAPSGDRRAGQEVCSLYTWDVAYLYIAHLERHRTRRETVGLEITRETWRLRRRSD